jgi:hypothetical protein
VDDLGQLERLRTLPPGIPEDALAEVARELGRPADREACEREITEAVRLQCLGDLTSFDRLRSPLKAVAQMRFENAVERGLVTAAIFNASTGLSMTRLGWRI